MADTVNVRDVRVQHLALDDSPAKLRDVRLQFAEDTAQPGGLRRLHGQVLVIAKDSARVRDVRVQSVEDYAKAAGFRRMTGMVLTRLRGEASVRDVRVQYLEIDNSHPNFANDAWTRLLYVANAQNGWNFTKEQITPATPEAHNVAGMWNTRVKITAQPSSGFSGDMYLYYQRYPINTRFKEIGHPFLNLTGKTSVKDVLPDLNSWFSMSLSLNDVEDSPIVDGKFTLTAKEGSWYFLPGTTFKFVNLPDLTTMYPKTKLNGWDGATQPGGILFNTVGSEKAQSGIYKIMADDGSFFDAYVDMQTDGGYWIQVGDWAGAVSRVVAFNDTIVEGMPIKGLTTDAVNRPVIPPGKLNANKSKQWMLQSAHPGWVALFGSWIRGKILQGTSIAWNVAIPVQSELGAKAVYGWRTGWTDTTYFTSQFALWPVTGNGGPCGGANVGKSGAPCPVFDSGGGLAAHTDYVYRKRLFIRATNFPG